VNYLPSQQELYHKHLKDEIANKNNKPKFKSALNNIFRKRYNLPNQVNLLLKVSKGAKTKYFTVSSSGYYGFFL
jgi:hypothetical protein